MDSEEKKLIEQLDKAVNTDFVIQQIDLIVKRVELTLNNNPSEIMAWESIPLQLYQVVLPDEIKSSWVFILRKNSSTGAERHPNSIQRMMSYKGEGDFQTKPDRDWISNLLQCNPKGDIEKRWISIPEKVWHQGIVANENWIVISFHTAEVSELIEERSTDGDETNISNKKYIDVSLNKE